MKKIISLFARNYDGDRLVRNEVVPSAEWVGDDEGVATLKHDGTCCMVQDGILWKRHEVKKGGKIPYGFEAATEEDAITGKTQGWLLVGDGPEDKWHREALQGSMKTDGTCTLKDGTYELCGPKIQGNPEGFVDHKLVPHGYISLPHFPRAFEEIKSAFASPDWRGEGVVWHHPDGRMVKIKKRDFFKK